MILQGPPMKTPRAYGASVSFGNVLYTLGGMEFMQQSFQTSKMQVSPHQVFSSHLVISITSLNFEAVQSEQALLALQCLWWLHYCVHKTPWVLNVDEFSKTHGMFVDWDCFFNCTFIRLHLYSCRALKVMEIGAPTLVAHGKLIL